jgi:hypothetical protein
MLMKTTPPATYRPDPNTQKPNSTPPPASYNSSVSTRQQFLQTLPAIVRKTARTITPAGRQAGNVSSHITPHHTNKRQMPAHTQPVAAPALPAFSVSQNTVTKIRFSIASTFQENRPRN